MTTILKRGVCAHCGKTDERTASGRVYCRKCAQAHHRYNKTTREARKAAGICCVCGRASSLPGHTMCGGCLEKTRMAGRHYRATVVRPCPYQKGGELSCLECKRERCIYG